MTDAAGFLPLPGAPLPMQTQPQARPANAPSAAENEVERAAREFEAMFLAEMLAPMFENLDTEGLGGGGLGEQIFRPMLVERYAQAIAQSGGVGLADSIVGELMRLQAGAAILTGDADGTDR
ncbi:MAG: rod-binding protein [Hyphomonadaceae bacterium]